MKYNYLHTNIPEITTDFFSEGNIVIRNYEKPSASYQFDIALLAYEIGLRVGIKSINSNHFKDLPYSDKNDHLLFKAPLIGHMVNQNMYFLRGWKQFDSCIKGFNSLGLLAEQVYRVKKEIQELKYAEIIELKKAFLLSRKIEGKLLFTELDVNSMPDALFSNLSFLDLSLWRTYATKPIVCSTSSNMGISLHQGLRYLQCAKIDFNGKTFNILNKDEGSLIIWCPDEEADFMNTEKTEMLKSIEREEPELTKLHTYINRQQRDPGALKDAMNLGGYFFPTNPQSIDEIQNLLFIAFNDIMSERQCRFEDLLSDAKILYTLQSLNCEVQNRKIYLNSGVEGGINGLMLPYLILLEEFLSQPKKVKGISLWNQASIGAALAAAVDADSILREVKKLNEKTRSNLNGLFPNISKFLDNKKIGKDIKTTIHGLFDLANLQSLAQLLGVVVDKHLSGRGTAYVGLGSSSYSNGNKCYDILNHSIEKKYSFRGKSTFHPATHTLNPFAQALVFGEDMVRARSSESFVQLKSEEEQVAFVSQHSKKPEPAGAAALAGYLLSRLDCGTLSVVEIAYSLKLLGFTKNTFLEFSNYEPNEKGLNKFFQEAQEEGRYMAELAKDILLMLDWPIQEFHERNILEKAHSVLRYKLRSLDPEEVTRTQPAVCIYLTGDNTSQPSFELVRVLIVNSKQYYSLIQDQLIQTENVLFSKLNLKTIDIVSSVFSSAANGITRIERFVSSQKNSTISYLINRKAKAILKK